VTNGGGLYLRPVRLIPGLAKSSGLPSGWPSPITDSSPLDGTLDPIQGLEPPQVRISSEMAMTPIKNPQHNNSPKFRRAVNRTHQRWALVERLLNWVRREFFPLGPSWNQGKKDNPVLFQGKEKFLGLFLRKLRTVVLTRGVTSAIPWIKDRRQVFLKWVSLERGSPEEISLRSGVKGTFGSQVVFAVQKFQDGNPEYKIVLRMVLTALASLRGFRLPVEIKYDPISSPPSVNLVEVLKEASKIVPGFLRELGFSSKNVPRNIRRVAWNQPHFTVKGGPAGPALFSWFHDFLHLGGLRSDLEKMGGPGIEVAFRLFDLHKGFLLSHPQWFPTEVKRKGSLRRLSGIADSEGKTRVVAMMDYWSQSVLKPLHDFLFRVLKTIPQDVTFDQGAFKEKMVGWPDGKWYSVDLTAATDRFPIDLIILLLERIFGQDYSSSWKRVMVGLPFECPDGETRSYGTGNPMGAYSSWGSFALAHHFVVYWCCRNLGIKWKTAPYSLLGDDILIGDSRLGEEYTRVLLTLGVEFSEAKTYRGSSLCEFAKRHFYLGEEVTGFPVNSLLSAKAPELSVAILIGEEKKGLFPKSGIPGAVGLLTHVFAPENVSPGTAIRTRKRRARESEIVARVLSRSVPVDEGVNLILNGYSSLRETWKEVSPGYRGRLFNQACLDLLWESLGGEDEAADDSWGWMVNDIFDAISSHSQGCVYCPPRLPDSVSGYEATLWSSVPHTGVYLQCELRNFRATRDFRLGFNLSVDEWPDFLRSLVIRQDGLSFLEKPKARMVVSSRLAAKVVQRAKGSVEDLRITQAQADMASIMSMPSPFGMACKGFVHEDPYLLVSSPPVLTFRDSRRRLAWMYEDLRRSPFARLRRSLQGGPRPVASTGRVEYPPKEKDLGVLWATRGTPRSPAGYRDDHHGPAS